MLVAVDRGLCCVLHIVRLVRVLQVAAARAAALLLCGGLGVGQHFVEPLENAFAVFGHGHFIDHDLRVHAEQLRNLLQR